ncbi:hypothetical protein M7I_1166 [Glarea lozoyensis 74030]|nr:hypothetical protein M7I_1166 [Glarea lozoyensis 74030]
MALAPVVLGEDVVWFENYTPQERWIVFSSNPPWNNLPDIYLPGGSRQNPGKVTVNFDNKGPDDHRDWGWRGNWKVLAPGQDHGALAILGEVCFRCDQGFRYFDVSAVLDPNSNIGVNYLFPFYDHSPNLVSGCPHFPCPYSYTKFDDVQTKVTWDTHLVCQVKPY